MYPRITWKLIAFPLASAEHFGNHCSSRKTKFLRAGRVWHHLCSRTM